MNEINILYAIDEGKKDYSRYLGVSILSLLENNKEENVHIYILSQYIEESNKKELIRIVNEYGKKIDFSEGEIIPERFKKILYVGTFRPIAMYYRWFFKECFDIKDRVLYLDCDTIINRNLSKIYNLDFKGNVIIGKGDISLTQYTQTKRYGLEKYINSGVMLINVRLFNDDDLYKGVIDANKKYNYLNYPDQDYINIIYKDKIKIEEKLQLIACFCHFKCYTDYSDRYIIHTTSKPNSGGLSFCPKEIEEIFNKYLEQTKWKTYIGYKKEISFREDCNNKYNFLASYCKFSFAVIFGARSGIFIEKMFHNVGFQIGKLLRAIKFFK